MVAGSFKAYKVSTLVSCRTGSFALHCNSWGGRSVCWRRFDWVIETPSNYLKLKGAVVAGETQVSHNMRIGSAAPFQQEREMKLQNHQLPRHLLHWLLRGPWSLSSASLCIFPRFFSTCCPAVFAFPSTQKMAALHFLSSLLTLPLQTVRKIHQSLTVPVLWETFSLVHLGPDVYLSPTWDTRLTLLTTFYSFPFQPHEPRAACWSFDCELQKPPREAWAKRGHRKGEVWVALGSRKGSAVPSIHSWATPVLGEESVT